MTRKLYYEDCNRRTFSAKVLSSEPAKGGFCVVLDATAFYPEGGGQDCDTGTLGSARVLQVFEQGQEVVHLCDAPLEVGKEVAGVLDWQRRFDLMQQHTGEHILSGVIHKKYGAHNVGFHIGAQTVTIDFDVPIPQEDLQELENLANRAIYEDLTVDCRYPSKDALKSIPYRSKKTLDYPVRIVTVPGYDCCACCGVHTQTTGQVGLIKILSLVKFHAGVRLEMLCGNRALNMFQKVWEQNRLVSQAFSAKVLETGAAAQRMRDALAAEKFRANGLQRRVFDAIAQGYSHRETVLHFEKDLAPGQVRELADRIAAVCGGTAAVFSGDSFCLVGQADRVKALGQKLTASFGGRGGGKDGVFQGSLTATEAEIRKAFQS